MTVALGSRKKEIPVPSKNGNRIGRIIKRGVSLRRRLDELKVMIEKNNEVLLPHAEHLREKTGLKSAVFKSADGVVTVKFSESITYDEKDMGEIKGILGPVFTQMFHEIPSFAVNPEDIPEIKNQLGKNFDRLVQTQYAHRHTKDLVNLIADGDSETAKKLREKISIETKKPSVSYEAAGEDPKSKGQGPRSKVQSNV